MVDDLTLGPATGRAVVAADDIGGVLHRRVKVQHGADGSATDVSTASPMPVVAALATNAIQDGLTILTPKFAVIDLTATGTLVAAVVGKQIRVLSLLMVVDNTTANESYIFKSDAAGTVLTGPFAGLSTAATHVMIEYGFSSIGHFQTISGELLELSLAGTTPIARGSLVYVEV